MTNSKITMYLSFIAYDDIERVWI